MLTRDPNILLDKARRPMIAPAKVLRNDLDDPAVFNHSPLTVDASLTPHWGGGPNSAGEPIEEPDLTFWQKIEVEFGRVKPVVQIWESWHMNGPADMVAIAYCTGAGARMGRLFRFRGHRQNGGQWGTINRETHAFVFVLGFGQYPSRKAWQALGMVWFSMGDPDTHGHRFWNDDPRSKTKTSCPGDEISAGIANEEHVRALGYLRFRSKVRFSRGRAVLLWTARLVELGFMDEPTRLYRWKAVAATKKYQEARDLVPDGIVGKVSWKDAAILER